MIGLGLVFVLLNLFLAGGPKDLRVFERPTSSPVQRRVAYPVHLLTSCAPVIDFDAGFWAPPGGWTLQQPVDPATAEVLDPGHAILQLGSGQRIRLERRQPPIRLSRCVSSSP